MIREYMKCIIWPRGSLSEGNTTNYRYIIVGMLITDKPIESIEEKNEVILEDNIDGLVRIIESSHIRKPEIPVGDASDVLLSLKDI